MYRLRTDDKRIMQYGLSENCTNEEGINCSLCRAAWYLQGVHHCDKQPELVCEMHQVESECKKNNSVQPFGDICIMYRGL